MPSMSSPTSAKGKQKDEPTVTVTSLRSSESSSSDRVDMTSMPTSTITETKAYTSPRKARFAEATAVYSPVDTAPKDSFAGASVMPRDGRAGHRSGGIPAAFNSYHPQQPVEMGTSYGYGYPGNAGGYGHVGGYGFGAGVEMPMTPFTPYTPWKTPLRTPGTAGGPGGMMSPTWNEERLLEKREEGTDKEQAKDLKVKSRVRLAKLLLRSTNFACSLIVLSMLASTFSIFNATKSLPPRNTLPPWAIGTEIWPQVTLLAIACVSLAMSVVVLWSYRKSNKRAERAAMYYNVFSMGFLGFSVVMWAVGAGVLHGSKQRGGGKDIWGWSCNDNVRHDLFQGQVSYDLVCRFQQWSLVCAIIEIIVELLALSVTLTIIYRLWSKRRLRKAMARRDRARSDLYLAHLRLQSAPNTPGGLELARRASIASLRAQHAVVVPKTVTVEQDVYADPFLTPALHTGQPLLAGQMYNAGHGHAQIQGQGSYYKSGTSEARAQSDTDTAAIVASPGPSTKFAAPKPKPFKLSQPPKKKGKGVATSSMPTSPDMSVDAGSTSFGSPGPFVISSAGQTPLGSATMQEQAAEGMQSLSIVPTPTSGMMVPKRLSHAVSPPPLTASAEGASQSQLQMQAQAQSPTLQPTTSPTTSPTKIAFTPPGADSPIKPQTFTFAVPAPSAPISGQSQGFGASQGRLPQVSQPLGPPTPLPGGDIGYYEQAMGMRTGWNEERRLEHMDAAEGEVVYERVEVPEGW